MTNVFFGCCIFYNNKILNQTFHLNKRYLFFTIREVVSPWHNKIRFLCLFELIKIPTQKKFHVIDPATSVGWAHYSLQKPPLYFRLNKRREGVWGNVLRVGRWVFASGEHQGALVMFLRVRPLRLVPRHRAGPLRWITHLLLIFTITDTVFKY